MPLIVEDGTIVADANSFASRASIIAYALGRGMVLTDDATTDVKAIKAMDYILSVPCWKGEIVELDQPLPFPRKGVVIGDEEDGYVFTIPANLVRAQCQLCCDIANGIDVMPNKAAGSGIKREKIGPIDTEYFEQTEVLPWLPIASAALTSLTCGQTAFSITTYRK